MKHSYLIIDYDVMVRKVSDSHVYWEPSLLSSLSRIAGYGLYTPVIRIAETSSPPEQILTYCTDILAGEKIFIERTIAQISELESESINRESSLLITRSPSCEALRCIEFTSWDELLPLLIPVPELPPRRARVERTTKETSISVSVNLDGTGRASVDTGIPFFDHMLDQIARHGRIDLDVVCEGDIHVDEHHSVEDTAICLGEAVLRALGDKRGIARYGDARVPMDDVTGSCVLDFSNRPYLLFDVSFNRDMVGTFPTEMVEHFFKSFSDESRANIHLSVSEGNTHHQVESLFKAFARALKQAVFRYPGNTELPTTKGML